MNFPKNQWIMQEPISECGFCDYLFTEQTPELGKAFQIELDNALVSSLAFNDGQNYFDLITSTDLEFTVIKPINYSSELQLYIGGKTYIFRWADISSVEVNGNVTVSYVDIAGGSAIQDGKLSVAIGNAIDALHGTTTNYASGTITIEDVPTGSYLNNINFIDNIDTVEAGTTTISNMVLTGTSLCHDVSETLSAENEPSVVWSENLTEDYLYYITIPYQSTHLNYTIQLNVTDGVETIDITLTPLQLTKTIGELVFNFKASNTATYTFTLTITPTEGNLNGLCLMSINLYTTYEEAIIIEAEDCNGTLTSLELEQWLTTPSELYYKNTFKAIIIDFLPTIFRLKITNPSPYGTDIFSRWYQIYIDGDCSNGKLYRLDWTNNCDLGTLYYSKLPFDNNLYVLGVLIKQANEMLNSVENITASGSKESVYKNTQSLYEFRMNPFLADTLETILEGVFMHKTVEIENIGYVATDTVQSTEIENGVYLGRVDVYKSGTNLISSRCC